MKELNGDIYILERSGNLFVVNNDYEGIFIVDSSLKFVKKIKIFNNIRIYKVFICEKENIVLFCPDNNCLVKIDLENERKYIVKLRGKMKKIIFSSYYWIYKDCIHLTDYNFNVYKVFF
ncbi:MAG: hypothetical protein IJ272_07400, partial [Clostridia bacterium]|nr:hypothetical protein [Clostridia bacterium]